MARREKIEGGTTTTLAPGSKSVLATVATKGSTYVRFALVNVGANPITAMDVQRSIGGLYVPDDAMNTAIAAKLPLAASGNIDIEYTRPIGDSLQVNITSALGADVEWAYYIDTQGAQSGPVPS